MFLKQHRNNKTGRTHLTIVQGFRENGKVKHKTVEVLGYLDELEKKYDDPVAHFKEEIRRRNEEEKKAPSTMQINLSAKLPTNCNERRNLGYAPLKSIYSELGLHDFFQNKQRNIGAEFNLNSIFSMMVFSRMLFPSSIKKAYENRHVFFEPFNFSLDDAYRALDYFWKYSNEIQKLLADKTRELLGRNDELGYYDVTNYYFEIPYEDEDEFDNDGNLVKPGQKKRGPSKEKRHDPIVQMGLLMDSNGIPLAFNMFPGNESEKVNMLPTIRRAKHEFGMERIVVVADRGLNTSDNSAFLSGVNDDDHKSGDGYVYGQSITGADSEFKKWVLDPAGYQVDDEITADGEIVKFKHKSRIYAKNVTLKNSNGKRNLSTQIYQKQMVYYSDKYARKQKFEREKLVAKAMDLIQSPSKYTRTTSYGAAAYVNNLKFNKKTGEIATGSELSLDESKIKAEAAYDGYYAIVTSEMNLEDSQIRDIYRGLWEIEESFKVIKSEFKARPVFVKTDVHVNAHFLICFVCLVIMRVLEKMLGEKYTTKELRDAMIRYSCSYVDQGYYLFDFRNKITDAIGQKFDWDLTAKYMSKSDMKKILKYTK